MLEAWALEGLASSKVPWGEGLRDVAKPIFFRKQPQTNENWYLLPLIVINRYESLFIAANRYE